jgi:hypothetical protein
MWKFGTATPSEFLHLMRPYNLKETAGRIACPNLIVDAENDRSLAGQPKQLYDSLTCQKTLMPFSIEEGAAEHCQVGGLMTSNGRILNWLQKVCALTKSG